MFWSLFKNIRIFIKRIQRCFRKLTRIRIKPKRRKRTQTIFLAFKSANQHGQPTRIRFLSPKVNLNKQRANKAHSKQNNISKGWKHRWPWQRRSPRHVQKRSEVSFLDGKVPTSFAKWKDYKNEFGVSCCQYIQKCWNQRYHHRCQQIRIQQELNFTYLGMY